MASSFLRIVLVAFVIHWVDCKLELPAYSKTELRRLQAEVEKGPPTDHLGKPKDGTNIKEASCPCNGYVDYGMRLIGCDGVLSPQAGRIEIYYKHAWGTVCDDYFDNIDGHVACYQLGFTRYSGLSLANNFGPGSLESSIVLDDLNCTGSETALDACPHAIWTIHNCFHLEDISIACVAASEAQKFGYLTRLVNNVENDTYAGRGGRLEIMYNSTWGTVCDDFFDNVDAAVACRALNQGYSTGIFLHDAPYGEGIGPIWLDTVLCTNADYNVGNCAHDPWGVHDCNHFEDVAIACGQCFDELCLNGGRCNSVDNPVCNCNAGYTGQRCETVILGCTSSPCLNGATCVSNGPAYICQCLPGFSGLRCEVVVTTPPTPPPTTPAPTTPIPTTPAPTAPAPTTPTPSTPAPTTRPTTIA